MKVSIITINYNNVDGLRRTIESVVHQTSDDFEYIVIDGGSSDGSVDVIKEYADIITYWVSEPDGGIYPAMNKGVRAVHGEYCIFMNSGDVFYSDTVLADFVLFSTDEDIVCGDLCIDNNTICKSPDCVTMKYLFVTTMYHQASFIKSDLLKEIPYDETMRVSGDWKFFFEALIMHNCSYRHIGITVANFESGGFSSHHMDIAMNEKRSTLQSIFPKRVLWDMEDYAYGFTNYRYMMNRVNEIPPVKKNVYKVVLILLKVLNVKIKSGWINKLTFDPDSLYQQ